MSMQDPSKLRKVYYDAWHKALDHQILSDLEKIIVDIIQRHPEYHPVFALKNFEHLQYEQFDLDHNPFFHLALHVTLAEQVRTDHPPGIKALYFKLWQHYNDQDQAEHAILDCLTKILMQAYSQSDADPTQNHDQRYLAALQELCA